LLNVQHVALLLLKPFWCGRQVTVRLHHRSSSLVYAPAYWLQYTYGVQHTPGRGDIVPEHFEMLVAGSGAGTVAAELHPSPAKAQVHRQRPIQEGSWQQHALFVAVAVL
jgi:hypothetical protein